MNPSQPEADLIPPRRAAGPVLVAGIAILVLLTCIAALLAAANGNRTTNEGLLIPTFGSGGTVRSANQAAAAAFAEHVDTTFYTLSAFFEDAEGGSFEQFAFDASFAADEETWIAAQPHLPCLTAAASQYAAAIAYLKAASDTSVEAYQSNDPVALASLSAKVDPARPALLKAMVAVDQAAKRC